MLQLIADRGPPLGWGLAAAQDIACGTVLGIYPDDGGSDDRYSLRCGTIRRTADSQRHTPDNLGLINDPTTAPPTLYDLASPQAVFMWCQNYWLDAKRQNCKFDHADFTIITSRDVAAGEELLVAYGADYWLGHTLKDLPCSDAPPLLRIKSMATGLWMLVINQAIVFPFLPAALCEFGVEHILMLGRTRTGCERVWLTDKVWCSDLYQSGVTHSERIAFVNALFRWANLKDLFESWVTDLARLELWLGATAQTDAENEQLLKILRDNS